MPANSPAASIFPVVSSLPTGGATSTGLSNSYSAISLETNHANPAAPKIPAPNGLVSKGQINLVPANFNPFHNKPAVQAAPLTPPDIKLGKFLNKFLMPPKIRLGILDTASEIIEPIFLANDANDPSKPSFFVASGAVGVLVVTEVSLLNLFS